MNEVEFKAMYVTQFLASYMAVRRDRDCSTGHIGKPYKNQPIEDALFLADCAWTSLMEDGGAGAAVLFGEKLGEGVLLERAVLSERVG